MKGKLVLLVFSCLMVLSLLLASCAPAAPTAPTAPTSPTGSEMVKNSVGKMVEKPQYGGTFTWVPRITVVKWDSVWSSPMTMFPTHQTHDELMGMDWARGATGTGEWAGILPVQSTRLKVGTVAESWEIPDEETLIYHIRKGVHFALDPNNEASRLVNGRELTAEDVAYSIMRDFDVADIPNAYHPTRWKEDDWPLSATATDKWTVVVKANPGHMDTVVLKTGDWTWMVARELVEKYGDLTDWKNSVGTGPFMVTDHVDDSSTTFARNPNYWQKDPLHPQNQLPYVDTVKFLYIKDPSTRLASVRTGKIDSLQSWVTISPDDAASLRATNPDMQFVVVIDHAVPTMHLRMDKPELPWYDIRVRHALQMAIDREAIVRDYYAGEAVIHAAPILPALEYMPAFTPLEEMSESIQELYKYQPEKAKQLLAEAGYPEGFKIEVTTTQSPRHDVDLLMVIKDYWEKIGVKVDVDIKERAVFTSTTAGKQHKHAVWATESTVAPYAMHSWTLEDPTGYAALDDPEANRVREIVMKNSVRNEALALAELKEFAPYTIEKSWLIHLPGFYKYIPYQAWVKGYSGESAFGYSSYLPTKYVWLDLDLKEKMIGSR